MAIGQRQVGGDVGIQSCVDSEDLAAYPRFDAIVAVGERVARDFAAWPARWAIDESRVHSIRNGIDTALFRPDAEAGRRVRVELGWHGELRVVVSASRLHQQKGIAHGLEAFALLAKQRADVRYLIVGEGPELQPLRERTVALGIEKLVHFSGGVEREAVPAYLNAADVMLFTTARVEGEPLNVLEALAVGLPVVASRHLYRNGAPSDRVLLVRPDRHAEVSAALRKALDLGPSRENELPKGYSLGESANAYLTLFERLVEQARA